MRKASERVLALGDWHQRQSELENFRQDDGVRIFGEQIRLKGCFVAKQHDPSLGGSYAAENAGLRG
jgi:hypothetical protein